MLTFNYIKVTIIVLLMITHTTDSNIVGLGSPKELVIVIKLRCSINRIVVVQSNKLGLGLT